LDLVLLDVWGWVCAAVGSIIAIPQVATLLRERTSAGLSLLMWQFNTAAAIGWTVHGLRGGWWNITLPNALMALTSGLVVAMVSADRRIPAVRTWPLIVAVSTVLVAVEFLATPAVFGAVVLIPLATGMIGQTMSIVRAPDVLGVSGFFVAMSAALQVMWWLWAAGAGDQSILICATVLGVIAGFNAVWYTLRSRGVIGARTPQPAART
jgi:uncharacterized protein with PQ loop repeat